MKKRNKNATMSNSQWLSPLRQGSAERVAILRPVVEAGVPGRPRARGRGRRRGHEAAGAAGAASLGRLVGPANFIIVK